MGSRSHWGVTLVELLVVLVIVGTITALSGLAVTSLRVSPTSERAQRLERARTQALIEGHAVMIELDSVAFRFLPDGRAIGGRAVDPLTGDLRPDSLVSTGSVP